MTRKRWMCGVAAGVALSGCGDSTKPTPLPIPSFIVVGDTGGLSQLYRVEDSVETLISPMLGNDFDPMSAAGRLVFTSRRGIEGRFFGKVHPYFVNTARRTHQSVPPPQ